jgi:hypothetical protein
MDLIERRKDEGWQFAFLGADINAYTVARCFGIDEDAIVAYSGKRSVACLRETAAVFSALAQGQHGAFDFRTSRSALPAIGMPQRQRRRVTPQPTATTPGKLSQILVDRAVSTDAHDPRHRPRPTAA